MRSMTAVAAQSWGPPDVLVPVRLPVPEPSTGEIRVRVHAAGINPTDLKSRATGGRMLWADPPVLGYDVSGTVDAVADGSVLHRPGDEVFGMPRFPYQAGAYAEFVTGPARHFAPKPATINHVEAASLPLASLTALHAVQDAARLVPGQRLLVCGAAGGVGQLAVQIAHLLGISVTASARGSRRSLCMQRGAEAFIPADEDGLPQVPGQFDCVLDPFGGARVERLLEYATPGGTVVSLIPRAFGPAERRADERGVRLLRVIVEPDGHGLTRIASWVDSGHLLPRVGADFPLVEAAAAHQALEEGRIDGKAVLIPVP
ncbi:NADP-dependent oxidoreductase [Sediminivirga luteola]|uniref:NADPH:quinone reductase n=1 Tax=Sediminivirga luteola TaxID=1774748 RepID=A0A8J2TZX0_9MICO|nr:NADP-dependent oxidoreductase [Sediminivirga luteola]MCI2265141.1 NADP-dependent oxidoreductase [Sediminivirga luteola]GGA22077.1 NADPH:quinone reductase [Sediminivirga luteola]